MRKVHNRGSGVEFINVARIETMFSGWMRRLGYYSLALLFVAVAAVLRWALPEVLGPTPFLAFYLAWVGAAAFGGLGPGLLAVAASALCLAWLFDFISPRGVWENPVELGRLTVFMVGGLIVSLVAERMQRGRVHERRQAQELRESQERLAGIVNSAMDGIVSVNEKQRIVLFNPAAEKMFGYRAAEIVGEPLERLIPKRFRRAHQEHIRYYAKTGMTTRRMGELGEITGLRASGEEFPLEASISQIAVAGGTLFTAILRDITERKRAEEALCELNATLENKVAERTADLLHRTRQLQKLTLELSETEDRERERMAEILHDDLQQILAAAKFRLGMLNRQVREDSAQFEITSQVDQMLKDAIEKSRSLSHELSPPILRQGDLGQTFQWLANQMQAKYGLTAHVRAYGEIRLQSEALKAFLYRAAQELLFNIVKHARIKEAAIRVRRIGPYVGLSVSDRGHGFDPHKLKATAGFGLLSIQERVDSLGGRMKIRSAEGKGSTFHIVVPASEQGATPGRENVEAAVPSPATSHRRSSEEDQRLRVLLADDHQIVRTGLVSLLSEDTGVQVVGEAADGREAVNLACELQPDVVVMDVSMPLMSGDEAAQQIKKYLPQTRIVALSMHDEAEVVERMRRAGAESYILKTAPSEELLGAIRAKRTSEGNL